MKIKKELAEKAFEAIAPFVVDCKIEKEYKSDISSYAPSIIQAGLFATVIFYQIPGNDGDAHERKNNINKAILDLLKYLYSETLDANTSLYEYIKLKDEGPAKRKILLQRMELSLGALKLAIRFYPDNKKEEI